MPTAVFAAKTADVVITATPGYISISVDPGVWNPSVTESTTENTTTTYFTVTNACTIVTDQTIGVNTTDNWSGGAGWIHSDTCVPAVATVGLKANKGGTWGTSDITVPKIASAAMLSDNQTTGGSYQFGLSIWAPTSFLDGDAKVVTTRITAAAAN
ncbi:hypothetical protein MUP46_01020 [Patescibacteria group bacterium]|nr:hypothetical protein [Patescibacteria group bacterium]